MEDGRNNILFPTLLTAPLLALVWLIAVQPPAQPTAATAEGTPAMDASIYRTTAAQLYHDYRADAPATQARIGQQRILITGTVVGVSTDYLGQNLVLLDAGNGMSTDDMMLAADQNLLAVQLQRGQTLSLYCDQMQRYSDSPTGSNCTLAHSPIALQAAAPSLQPLIERAESIPVAHGTPANLPDPTDR